jgi:molecular chaperone DnaK
MAKDNKQIGLFNLDGIMPARRGIPQIKVKFDIDANGILSVSATDNATGKEQHITIENKNTLSQEEIDRIKREAEENAEQDKKTQERIDKLNEIDSAIYQTENLIEEFKDKAEVLTEEDKNYLNNKIEELKSVKEGDLTGVDSILTELNNRLMSIGAKAYGTKNNQTSGGFDPSQFADMFKNGNFNGTNNASAKNAKTEDVEEV